MTNEEKLREIKRALRKRERKTLSKIADDIGARTGQSVSPRGLTVAIAQLTNEGDAVKHTADRPPSYTRA